MDKEFFRKLVNPKQPDKSDWMGAFLDDINEVKKQIEEKAARDEKFALEKIKQKMDADAGARAHAEELMNRRNETLRKAWFAQALLVNKYPMDEWIDLRPDFDTKGVFRKKIKRTRKRMASIAFSGWALDERGKLLITTDLDNPLAIAKREYPRDPKADSLTVYRYYRDHEDFLRKERLNVYQEARVDENLRTYDPRDRADKLNGWHHLCTVENKLIPVTTNNIKEVNQYIHDNWFEIRDYTIEFGDNTDVDYRLQKMMAVAIAKKIKNPTGEPVMGRSFF
jgi:hypothetical protein